MGALYMIIGEIKHMLIPCLVSFPIIIFIRFIVYKKKNEFSLKKEAIILLFWVYIVALFSVTMVPEHAFGEANNSYFHLPDFSNPNTINFQSPVGWIKWKLALESYTELIRNIIGNVVIFIPFGTIVPIIWKKAGAKTVLYGFLLSLFIEFLQLFIDRQTDLYDIIMNTAGAAIGYLIFIILKKIRKCAQVRKK